MPPASHQLDHHQFPLQRLTPPYWTNWMVPVYHSLNRSAMPKVWLRAKRLNLPLSKKKRAHWRSVILLWNTNGNWTALRESYRLYRLSFSIDYVAAYEYNSTKDSDSNLSCTKTEKKKQKCSFVRPHSSPSPPIWFLIGSTSTGGQTDDIYCVDFSDGKTDFEYTNLLWKLASTWMSSWQAGVSFRAFIYLLSIQFGLLMLYL